MVNEIRVIANEKEKTKINHACHDGVDGYHYKSRAKEVTEFFRM